MSFLATTSATEKIVEPINPYSSYSAQQDLGIFSEPRLSPGKGNSAMVTVGIERGKVHITLRDLESGKLAVNLSTSVPFTKAWKAS